MKSLQTRGRGGEKAQKPAILSQNPIGQQYDPIISKNIKNTIFRLKELNRSLTSYHVERPQKSQNGARDREKAKKLLPHIRSSKVQVNASHYLSQARHIDVTAQPKFYSKISRLGRPNVSYVLKKQKQS